MDLLYVENRAKDGETFLRNSGKKPENGRHSVLKEHYPHYICSAWGKFFLLDTSDISQNNLRLCANTRKH
jgi:hypothetical protein